MMSYLEETMDTTNGELESSAAGPGSGLLLVQSSLLAAHGSLCSLACDTIGAGDKRNVNMKKSKRMRRDSCANNAPDNPFAPFPDIVYVSFNERIAETVARASWSNF